MGFLTPVALNEKLELAFACVGAQNIDSFEPRRLSSSSGQKDPSEVSCSASLDVSDRRNQAGSKLTSGDPFNYVHD